MLACTSAHAHAHAPTHLVEVVLAARDDAKLIAGLVLHQTYSAHVSGAISLIDRANHGRRPGSGRIGDACCRPLPRHAFFYAAHRRPTSGSPTLELIDTLFHRGLFIARLR